MELYSFLPLDEASVSVGERLRAHSQLSEFVTRELLPGLDITPEQFWGCLSSLVTQFAEENSKLLQIRDSLQKQIDQWHRKRETVTREETQASNGVETERSAETEEPEAYEKFLRQIGYLSPATEGNFTISSSPVDEEMAKVPAPQLVVPIKNARFAINAANARWGSLLNALYGTNAIAQDKKETEEAKNSTDGLSPTRVGKVFSFLYRFLDQALPLEGGKSFGQLSSVSLNREGRGYRLRFYLSNGEQGGGTGSCPVHLLDSSKFVGFTVQDSCPSSSLPSSEALEQDQLRSLFFKNNGLLFEIRLTRDADRKGVAALNTLGIEDVVMEAATTVIQDFEDSVSAVDVEDKLLVYRHWLHLMKGDISCSFSKGGRQIKRTLNGDIKFIAAEDGSHRVHKGTSLLLARNNGLHMYTNIVTAAVSSSSAPDSYGLVPEGFLDALITVVASMHDGQASSRLANSKEGNIYIVKPKLHGPDEVSFTCSLFSSLEQHLRLRPNSIKLGIMDEERRTSASLLECVRRGKDRVAFINTGFMDRTGDEIHTSMEKGPMKRKDGIKREAWLDAYEKLNVAVGLKCGFSGRAQIGKGMWAQPDDMAGLLASKVEHLKAGATTAWVPSPTAAVIHALHYHQVDVFSVHQKLLSSPMPCSLSDLLRPPLMKEKLQDEEVREELYSCCQAILGYVCRWVDQGIGCSKVPDIHNINLMEDRATLRINAQLLANWLRHGVISKEEVQEAFLAVSSLVDEQNAGDGGHCTISDIPSASLSFQAALELVYEGCNVPNGYTEYTLHQKRIQAKAKQAKKQ